MNEGPQQAWCRRQGESAPRQKHRSRCDHQRKPGRLDLARGRLLSRWREHLESWRQQTRTARPRTLPAPNIRRSPPLGQRLPDKRGASNPARTNQKTRLAEFLLSHTCEAPIAFGDPIRHSRPWGLVGRSTLAQAIWSSAPSSIQAGDYRCKNTTTAPSIGNAFFGSAPTSRLISRNAVPDRRRSFAPRCRGRSDTEGFLAFRESRKPFESCRVRQLF